MTAFADYSRYYDLLYRDKNYRAEAEYVARMLKVDDDRPRALLDVGCGTGAHLREFAALGWEAAGVDISPQMIAIARERSVGSGEIDYQIGAAADFHFPRTFNAVVSLFHVVSYQADGDDAFRMFRNVRRHLLPGGFFIFDFWHGPGVWCAPPSVRVRRAEDDRVQVTRIAEPQHWPERCRVDVRYELLVEERASGRVERTVETHCLRYFFLPELRFLLAQAGFEIERAVEAFSEHELHGRAWQGLVVARAT